MSQHNSSGSKVAAPRLRKNTLSLSEVISASLANIAPAMCIFFSLAVIVQGAGIAAPLTIILATIAILFQANTVCEFTKAIPSAGSFVTFIGKSFGGTISVLIPYMVAFEYIIAIGGVIAMAGDWTTIILSKYLGITIPWQIISLIFVAFVMYLTVSGVKISTKWVITLFFFEVGLLMVATVAMLVANHAYITLAPFSFSNVKGGLAGIGLGFPLAVFNFIGFANSAAMAEETQNPRRAIPLAVYLTVASAGIMYVLFTYATIVGYHNNAAALASAEIPFIDASSKVLGSAVILVYLSGLTSIFACLIGAANAQARMIFSAAREGTFPAFLARVNKNQTPWAAISFYFAAATLIVLAWGIKASPLDLFGLLGTLGAIPVILMYIIANFALTKYYRQQLPHKFSVFKHLIVPLLGTISLILPLWGLIQPGQPSPYNMFTYIVLAYLVIVFIYAYVIIKKNPDIGLRVGSVVADE